MPSSSPANLSPNLVELIEVAGEWYVRVVENGRETVHIFPGSTEAVACAEEHRMRLGLEKYDEL